MFYTEQIFKTKFHTMKSATNLAQKDTSRTNAGNSIKQGYFVTTVYISCPNSPKKLLDIS